MNHWSISSILLLACWITWNLDPVTTQEYIIYNSWSWANKIRIGKPEKLGILNPHHYSNITGSLKWNTLSELKCYIYHLIYNPLLKELKVSVMDKSLVADGIGQNRFLCCTIVRHMGLNNRFCGVCFERNYCF